MPYDVSPLAAAERRRLIVIGMQFGSDDALAQGRQTLNALSTHAAVLADFGFEAADVTELAAACDGLVEAGVGREGARSDRKATNAAVLDAMFVGKSQRMAARAALVNARRRLAKSGGNEALIRSIEATLDRTRSAGADPEELATQLDQLRTTLVTPGVAGMLRNAEALAATLTTRAEALRIATAQAAGPRGTPEQTEVVNVLDGLIVELVRAARLAARAAARERGQPAIAKAFELTALYRSTGRRAPIEPSGPTG